MPSSPPLPEIEEAFSDSDGIESAETFFSFPLPVVAAVFPEPVFIEEAVGPVSSPGIAAVLFGSAFFTPLPLLPPP